jgi:mannose-6-phosphate isomerase-like protein (cupin superfamily)
VEVLSVVSKQFLKNFDKLPGWLPLFAVTMVALQVVDVIPHEIALAGRKIPSSLEIVAGFVTIVLYYIGDALDEWVFKVRVGHESKTRPKYAALYRSARDRAIGALGINDGSYDVALALAKASEKTRSTILIQCPNELAKCLRAFIFPGAVVAVVGLATRRVVMAGAAAAVAVAALAIYPRLKVWHLRQLYGATPAITGAPEYKRRTLGDLRLFFWKAALVGSAALPVEPVLAFKVLPDRPDAVAPDGSDVRLLLGLAGGGVAHFQLAPGEVSIAVAHRTIEEIWFFLGGRGEMWRRLGDAERVDVVERGVCLTIPLGTKFQFRAFGSEPLAAIGVTMPPWPGDGEAYRVEGTWRPTCTPEGSV